MAANPAATGGEYQEYTSFTRWIILVTVMLGTILEVLDVSIVNVSIPDMMGNLGATLDQISWVSTAYIIANVIILPLTGWLSSYFGRRKYLAFSMALFTTASFFCGTARSLNALIFFRILQGAGGAALLSTAQATIMEVFPPAQLGMVQAIFSLGVVVAPTLGPTMGGWISDNYSWPWIFFVNVPIGILATIMTLIFVRDSKFQKAPTSRVDVVGIGLLAVGIGSLQAMLEKGNREGWLDSELIRWLMAGAIIGLALFVLWELHTPNPAVNLRVLRNRGLAAGTVYAAVLGFGLYGGIFILPVFLQSIRHYSAMQSGMIVLPGGVATLLMLPIMGRLVMKTPPRNLVALGSIGLMTSMFWLHGITADTGPDQIFWPLVLRGASLGFMFVPLTLASLAGLHGRDLAGGTGLYNLMRQLGGSAGIAFLSTLLDHRTALHRASLVEHVNAYSPAFTIRLAALTQGFLAKGFPAPVAQKQALSVIDGAVSVQAAIMAYEDAFLVVGVAFMLAFPLLILFKKQKPGESLAARGAGH
ncbi:MAG TPA: DHA2 family efflux MFS transporter permease subunit [Armatimonadota bacterium]|jgi:DHA2 family multidrug resistance protein